MLCHALPKLKTVLSACNYRNAAYTALLKLGVSPDDVLLYSSKFDAIPE